MEIITTLNNFHPSKVVCIYISVSITNLKRRKKNPNNVSLSFIPSDNGVTCICHSLNKYLCAGYNGTTKTDRWRDSLITNTMNNSFQKRKRKRPQNMGCSWWDVAAGNIAALTVMPSPFRVTFPGICSVGFSIYFNILLVCLSFRAVQLAVLPDGMQIKFITNLKKKMFI